MLEWLIHCLDAFQGWWLPDLWEVWPAQSEVTETHSAKLPGAL